MPQIYVCLEFVRRIFFSSAHLLQSLVTEMAAFVSLQLLCRRRLCFWMHSDIHFCCRYYCQSLCHSFRLLVTCRDLSFAHVYFSRYPLPFRVVYFAFFSLSSTSWSFCCPITSLSLIHFSFLSASHSFTSASPSQGRHGRFLIVPRVPHESG